MLDVYLNERLIGVLNRKDNGNLQFKYAPSYVESDAPVAISQSLPVRIEPFPHRTSLAFFGGLLPEAEARDQAARAVGVSPTNDFVLLEYFGGDCAGAVSLLPQDEVFPASAEPQLLDAKEIDELIESLPQRPLAADSSGAIRLSLAGAQVKIPVIYIDGQMALPRSNATPTTHILKPEPSRFPGLVINEAFCMWLARAVELAVAEVATRKTGNGLPYLMISRYDRDLTHDPIRRLHQEDFCQALGRLPNEKYQQEGGPTVRDAMELLTRASAVPAEDRPRLWDALVFNVLVGNCDAHGKNYSLVYDSRAPHLAPLYDLVSTAIHDGLSRRLAMSINGARQLDDVGKESWQKLADDIGFNTTYAESRRRQLTQKVTMAAETLADTNVAHDGSEGAKEVVAQIVEGIQKRADQMA